jgi:hypothetical protein
MVFTKKVKKEHEAKSTPELDKAFDEVIKTNEPQKINISMEEGEVPPEELIQEVKEVATPKPETIKPTSENFVKDSKPLIAEVSGEGKKVLEETNLNLRDNFLKSVEKELVANPNTIIDAIRKLDYKDRTNEQHLVICLADFEGNEKKYHEANTIKAKTEKTFEKKELVGLLTSQISVKGHTIPISKKKVKITWEEIEDDQ